MSTITDHKADNKVKRNWPAVIFALALLVDELHTIRNKEEKKKSKQKAEGINRKVAVSRAKVGKLPGSEELSPLLLLADPLAA